MPEYRTKTPEQHAWEDARDLSRAEIRRLVRRITDLAYTEINALFLDAATRDESIEVRPDAEDIKTLVRKHSTKVLEA